MFWQSYSNSESYEAQWNLSKVDTLGDNIFVRFRQLSALDMLGSWDLDQ